MLRLVIALILSLVAFPVLSQPLPNCVDNNDLGLPPDDPSLSTIGLVSALLTQAEARLPGYPVGTGPDFAPKLGQSACSQAIFPSGCQAVVDAVYTAVVHMNQIVLASMDDNLTCRTCNLSALAAQEARLYQMHNALEFIGMPGRYWASWRWNGASSAAKDPICGVGPGQFGCGWRTHQIYLKKRRGLQQPGQLSVAPIVDAYECACTDLAGLRRHINGNSLLKAANLELYSGVVSGEVAVGLRGTLGSPTTSYSAFCGTKPGPAPVMYFDVYYEANSIWRPR